MRSSEVCPPPPLPDDLRRQEWLSAHVVAFPVSGLFWLSVAGFRLPYSSIWLEGQCVYHKLVLEVSGTARSIGVPVSQYIDDWHMGQLFTAPLRMTRGPSFQRALAAAYIMCYLLVEAGYFIGLDKSQSTPSTCVCFLGFVCDSVRQAFVIPPRKKETSLRR